MAKRIDLTFDERLALLEKEKNKQKSDSYKYAEKILNGKCMWSKSGKIVWTP